MTLLKQFVEHLVTGLREISPRDTVELGVLHGFAVDAAQNEAPKLVAFLTSVDGLEAFCSELHRMPAVIEPLDVGGAEWRFVRRNPLT